MYQPLAKLLKALQPSTPPATANAAPPKPAGVFSTELHFKPRDQQARLAMLANTFQKPFPKPNKDGKTFSMDSATGMDEGIKSSFTSGIFGVPDAQLQWYSGQGFIGYQICAMLAQNWFIDKLCTLPAKDAVRNGFEVTVNDGKKVNPATLQQIAKADRRYNLQQNMVDFVRYGRMFGIRIAMFKVDYANPQKAYANPFNIDAVRPGSYKGITQIDPYWVAPLLDTAAASDPSDIHFYEPTWWLINGMRVHRSHLVISIPYPVADVIKPTYLYGGISVPQKVYERVYGAERTANEAPLLTMTKRLTVFYTDLAQAMANQQQFSERMEWWAQLMNNFGIKVAGEGDRVEQHDTSLTDLDEIIAAQYGLAAAAGDMPITKVMGNQPTGLNATGEYDEASYHEFLESVQSTDLTPLVNRHHELVIKSDGLGDFSVDIKWLPLDAPTAEEIATVQETKSRTDSNLVNSGAIMPEEVRARIIADPESGYNGLTMQTLPEDPGAGEEQVVDPVEEPGEPTVEAKVAEDAKGKKRGKARK